jgi:hypothetical protein
MTSFNEWEIPLFCPECGVEWYVKGKRLVKDRDVPCPACKAIVRVDVWDWHSQWARLARRFGWK